VEGGGVSVEGEIKLRASRTVKESGEGKCGVGDKNYAKELGGESSARRSVPSLKVYARGRGY